MTTELTLLTWSTALAFMQMCSTAGFLTLTYGIPVSLGNRMELPPHKGALLRSTRALQNMVESLVIFAAAILLAHAAGREYGLTTLGAQPSSGAGSPIGRPISPAFPICARLSGPARSPESRSSWRDCSDRFTKGA